MSDTVRHHNMPEIVIYRDTDDDWKRIGLVDDYGGKISLSVEQLSSLATEVLSDTFARITGLQRRRAGPGLPLHRLAAARQGYCPAARRSVSSAAPSPVSSGRAMS